MRKELRNGTPQNDFDRVHLLWADLRWPGLIDEAQRQELLDLLARHQWPDGGSSLRSFGSPESWGTGNRAPKLRAEKLGPDSDAHMTGLALIIFREAGISASDPRIRRGVDWLKSNQRVSGRWWTHSMNTDAHWQSSTYHGTAQALLALALCGEIPLQQP